MKSSVITEVVENNLCIGCGLCAAICPKGVIKMQWNPYGEFNPTEVDPCVLRCGMCLKVCPFADNEENEDTLGNELYGKIQGIGYQPETGYYLTSFVGYANGEYRKKGASGGMATWFLEKMLTDGIVDHVVCVFSSNDPDKLFDFRVVDTLQEVRLGAGSAYYPVEMSEVIRYILQTPGRYVITGLPCFIKAIRLAQKRSAILQERIIITVGLTCGQLKSRHFTSYITNLTGIMEDDLKQVHYRGKSPDTPASNFYFTFTRKNGTTERIFWDDGVSVAWLNRWFTINSCRYCDDIFAECADVTFMDAWLPEYSNDCRGTNIVLVRSLLVQDVIDRGMKGNEVNLNPVMIEKAVRSQAGVIDIKRGCLSYQLYLGQQQGLKIPKKRLAPTKLANPFLREEIFLKNRMQGVSLDCWDPKEQNTARLQEGMRPYMIRLLIGKQILKIIMFPIRTIRSIQRKIRSIIHE